MARIKQRLLAAGMAVVSIPALAQAVKDAGEVIERGPDHRVVQRVLRAVGPDGRATERVSRYVEVASGLHHWRSQRPDGSDGQWVETEEKFSIFPGGAVARGQHSVVINSDIQARDVVDLELGGRRFRSGLLGLAYTDMSSGKSALIGEPQPVVGELSAPNVVLFRNALAGPVRCDVRYTYTRSGFSQDLICRTRLPDPSEYGMEKEWTRVEVWSVLDTGEPSIRDRHLVKPQEAGLPMLDAGMVDESLQWGSIRIGPGRAFALDENESDLEMVVGKELLDLEGTRFLVEKIDFLDIEDENQRLPTATIKAANRASIQSLHQSRTAALAAALRRTRELREQKAKEAKAVPPASPDRRTLMASILPQPSSPSVAHEPGLVLDYQIINVNTNNVTFRKDTTYFVVGTYNLGGTNTIEGGTVIKCTNAVTTSRLTITGTLICETDRSRPAFFTSFSDDTVGETIASSTGCPTTNWCGTYLDFNGNSTPTDLHDLRVRHAYAAVRTSSSSLVTVRHSQFSSNYTVMYLGPGRLRNVLIHDGSYAAGGQGTCHFENATFCRLGNLRSNPGTNSSYLTYLTNCLVIAVTNFNDYFGTNNVKNTSDSGLFQVIGGARFYLAPSSSNRNTAITGIDPTLLTDLRRLTTYPPILITNHFTNDTVLAPQAQRDTDALDLGYHYPPLDYCWTALKISNARLTLTNDVAVGLYGSSSSYGMGLDSGGELVVQGHPHRMVKLLRYNLAQEGYGIWATSSEAPLVKVLTNGPVVPKLYYRFAESVVPAGAGEHVNAIESLGAGGFGFRDSAFASGYLVSTDVGVAFTNCIFDRVAIAIEGSLDTPSRMFTHNLFRGGEVSISLNPSAPVLAQNCLFDRTTILQSGGTWTHGWNGYYTNALGQVIAGAASSNRFLTSIGYQNGPLGVFYYPTNGGAGSLTDLVNAGTTNAQLLGFYHYTTATNQTKEANSLVDIGFRYIATTNGLPIDTNGDGIADWLSDASGNGTVDSGEIAWQTSGDQGFRVWITRPKPGSSVP